MILLDSNKTFTLTSDIINLDCCGFTDTSVSSKIYFIGLNDGRALNIVMVGGYCQTALVMGYGVDDQVVSIIVDCIPFPEEWEIIMDVIRRIDIARVDGEVVKADMAG